MLNTLPLLKKLQWIQKMTPLTKQALSKSKENYSNTNLGYVGHINEVMIPKIEHFINQGIQFHISPSVPSIHYDDCLDYLEKKGAKIYGRQSKNWEDLHNSWSEIIKNNPNFIIDVGGGLIKKAIESNHPLSAACEITGTGINIIQDLNPAFPLFNFDDVKAKDIIHNRYGIASSVWYGFRHFTGLDIIRSHVLVIGFGPVGQNIAAVAKGLGARVLIHEIDPLRKNIAASEGYLTLDLNSSIKLADIIVTATGKQNTITSSDLQQSKDTVFLINAGHDNREYNLSDCNYIEETMPEIDLYHYKDKSFYLVGKGNLLNLVAGGSALNSFDYITAFMTNMMIFLFNEGKDYPNGIHLLPEKIFKPILEQDRSLS